MDVLRLGIAGLGMSQARVLPEIAPLSFVRIAAAADLRPSARTAFECEFGAPAFASVDELCRFDGIDAIYVATPHEFHAPHSIAALENGKHVIVEKPMALSVAEAQAMNASAARNGLKLLAGHTHSFDPPIRKMAQLVARGDLGRPLMITSSYYKDHLFRPFSDDDIRISRGVVLNQGPHQVDIVRQIAGGMATSVRASAGCGEPTRPGEGHYVCYLGFANGPAAMLAYSGYAYFDSAELTWGLDEAGLPKDPQRHLKARRFYRGLGSGPARRSGLEASIEQRRYGASRAPADTHPKSSARQPFFGLTVVTCERGDIRQSPDGLYIYDDDGRREIRLERGGGAREAELREFFAAIREDRSPAHDGLWGMATLEVCEAILVSAAERREVSLCHQVPMNDFLSA